jgi:hypothetical protein
LLEIADRPVPPLLVDRVPTQLGENVWVSPKEVIDSWILESEVVANVCVEPF